MAAMEGFEDLELDRPVYFVVGLEIEGKKIYMAGFRGSREEVLAKANEDMAKEGLKEMALASFDATKPNADWKAVVKFCERHGAPPADARIVADDICGTVNKRLDDVRAALTKHAKTPSELPPIWIAIALDHNQQRIYALGLNKDRDKLESILDPRTKAYGIPDAPRFIVNLFDNASHWEIVKWLQAHGFERKQAVASTAELIQTIIDLQGDDIPPGIEILNPITPDPTELP